MAGQRRYQVRGETFEWRLHDLGMNKGEFAEAWGKDPGQVSRIISGQRLLDRRELEWFAYQLKIDPFVLAAPVEAAA